MDSNSSAPNARRAMLHRAVSLLLLTLAVCAGTFALTLPTPTSAQDPADNGATNTAPANNGGPTADNGDGERAATSEEAYLALMREVGDLGRDELRSDYAARAAAYESILKGCEFFLDTYPGATTLRRTEVAIVQGQVLIELERYADAATHFERLLLEQMRNDRELIITLHFFRAQALLYGGDRDEALVEFAAAREINPAMADSLRDRLFPRVDIGGEAPVLEGRDLAGEALRIVPSGEGVTVVVFWGTWAPPSQVLVADLAPLIAELVAAEVKVRAIGVVTDPAGAQADVTTFLEQHGIDWPHILDATDTASGALAEAYDVRVYPQTFIVGADGTVRAIIHGARTVERTRAAINAAID